LVREMPLDAQHRLQVESIQLQIRKDKAEGLQPFLVIASAGTTDTGAIDPLAEIASLAQKEGLWFHIDAAYGGFFMLLDQIKPLFKGIEQADSLVVDPHKGLFLPYGTGAVLVKDKSAVLHSNYYRANYMLDAIDDSLPVNPADVSPELTKHFRGLRIWLPLQLHGIEPFQACLEEKIYLTQYFREGLADLGFELGPEPDLTVSYFWYPAKETDINVFNEELMARIQKDGRVFLSSTRLDGRFVIRMAILSFRTKLETVDRALDMIRDILNELKKEGLT
ncbi:MAG: aminotransferase class V-fold PLP-dependent enzyme, partial [Saprospiraceae bacterium]